MRLDSVTPVILAGGPGYRLKPWSRPTCPKPFIKVGEMSLLQATLQRVKGTVPLVLCARAHLELARTQTATITSQAHFLVEPAMRNTAPAIAAATAYLLAEKGPDALMLVMPSDHAIDRADILLNAVGKQIQIGQGRILSFGIKPRKPSRHFGYILPEGNAVRFIEKPERVAAQKLIAAGAYWNSGIWMARVGTMQALFKELAPAVWQSAQDSVTYARHERDTSFLEERYFSASPSISIDKAVMEKAPGISLCPLDIGWRDLGTWPSMMAHLLGF